MYWRKTKYLGIKYSFDTKLNSIQFLFSLLQTRLSLGPLPDP